MRKAQTTPLIRRQTNSRSTVCTFRIGSETREQLQAYADFIHSGRSHVIREALRRLFCSDREFQRHLRKQVLDERGAESWVMSVSGWAIYGD